MQIGTIAKKIGLSVDTIRFYERRFLLPRPPRTQGGFRKYAESDVETLGFIRRVQGLGFTLNEVSQLLELRRSRLQPCAPVRRRFEQKVDDVRRKLADLRKFKRELRTALRSCNKEMCKRSAHCPLLTETSQRKSEGAKMPADYPCSLASTDGGNSSDDNLKTRCSQPQGAPLSDTEGFRRRGTSV
jgi:DNA-binding transcriptional MerR regulator